MLPRVSEFEYQGRNQSVPVRRVAIERGPDPRGCGLLAYQLVPEPGIRTFKPGKMINCHKLGLLKTLWYLLTSVRVQVG